MKKIIILGVICLFVGFGFQPAFANDNITICKEKQQPRSGTFMKTFGGTNIDGGFCVQQTTDGGYIITGYTNSFGADESDAWLIKTDSVGNKVWDRTFGGTDEDIGYSVQQTTDGGYIITGEKNSNEYDKGVVWLIKTDSTGNKVWDKTFGGSDRDEGHSVQQTSDGGYIVTGYTWSYGAGKADAWLVKTDKNGNSVWDNSLDRKSKTAGYNDILSIKTNKNGILSSKAVTSNMLLPRILERFPLLREVFLRLKAR